MELIEKIRWSVKYTTGVTVIDTERYQLLKSFNNLVASVHNKELFPEQLLSFTMACSTHFKNEEKYIADISFPTSKNHQIFHKSFMYELDLYNIECISGFSIEPIKVVNFIYQWWETHIQNEDIFFIEQQFKRQEQLFYEPEIA